MTVRDGRAALVAYGGEAARLLAAVAAIPEPDLSDPAVAEFAAQFALDVASLDATQRAAFLAATGPDAFGVVQQIYAHDLLPRVGAALDAVFGRSDWSDDTAAPADSWALLEEFMGAVARLRALDPTLTELVRLRGARLHDCAVCRSRRSQDALDHGATADDFAAIDSWAASDLPDATKAALALVDAVVLRTAVPADVRARLSDEQIVEVLLDVMRNAANKIAVALGADAAAVTDGVELFRTDADGALEVVGTSGSTLG